MIASSRTVLESLNSGLKRAFALDARVYLLGEDILDPYGGAFKVSRGLSSEFPQRVWSTPISEAGMVGVAAGMALRGLRPVVEIMFGDFLTLASDQIINHLAKFAWMYSGGKPPAEQIHVPLVIRTPMGGRRGYGPTHSQTLEKHFLGVPGLRVLAPSALALTDWSSPGGLLVQAILEDEQPVLFIENKLLYLLPILEAGAMSEWTISLDGQEVDAVKRPAHDAGIPCYPTARLSLRGAPQSQITLAAYGYMSELARQAAYRLAYEHEIFCDLVIPSQLAPFELAVLHESVRRTRRLLTIEESGLSLGWGAELLAQMVEKSGASLLVARRLAAMDLPVPSSRPLEQAILPGVDAIMQKCMEIIQIR